MPFAGFVFECINHPFNSIESAVITFTISYERPRDPGFSTPGYRSLISLTVILYGLIGEYGKTFSIKYEKIIAAITTIKETMPNSIFSFLFNGLMLWSI